MLSDPLISVPAVPTGWSPGGSVKVDTLKIKVGVEDGVSDGVTVGDGVRLGVCVGGIKVAVWLAAAAAVCAMIT